VNQPSIAELERTYDRRFADARDYRLKVWAVLIRDFFQQFIPEQGTVLDLGCGWGEFSTQVRAGRVLAMDLNPSAPRYLNDRITFLHQDCSQAWPLNDNSLDVVFTSNFFEHLPNKDALRAALIEAYRCLKPGGRLIALGPNIRYVPGEYWDFWDHFLPLTDRSLCEGLELCGFRIERAIARFLPYTMATGFNPPPWTVSVYLRVPAFWSYFGKQFLVLAVKP
jgi:SAM-dependent methyltransferase